MGERRVARKFDDAELIVLVVAEMRAAIFERGPGRGDHAVEVELVTRLIIDLELDVALADRIAPHVAFDRIPRRLEGVEVEDGNVHLVDVMVAPAFDPLLL